VVDRSKSKGNTDSVGVSARRDEMMQPKSILKQIIEFNKAAYENAFKNMNILQEQTEKVINLCIDQAIGASDESKRAARECVLMYRKGYEYFKKLADDNFRKMEALYQDKK